jgi:hypothetical protein
MQKLWGTKMAENRLSRELETRSTVERPKQWQRANVLPQPVESPGYKHRWVRVSTLSKADARNISSKLQEGWEPVRIEEQPQFRMFVDPNSRFKDNIEVAGLLLCKIPSEFVDQRSEFFSSQTKAFMDSVDNNFMRESDPRMPLFAEKKSKTSFGRGI